MTKKIIITVLLVTCILVLAGCSCDHVWVEADCLNAKTCSQCQETEGAALGHDWRAATCETGKTCSRCAEVEGEALNHDWNGATCVTAQTCKRCAKVGEAPLGHTPGTWNETADLVTCSVLKEQFCTVCNVLTASETVPLSTLIQDNLFVFTANVFMERLTQIAEQHSDAFTYEFVPNGVGLQVLADYHGTQSIIQFFRSDATALNNNEADTAEVWCVSLIEIGESDANFRYYFFMACDPKLDKDTSFELDIGLANAFLNASTKGEALGFYLHNGLLYETAHIAQGTWGQDYVMKMFNIYASDYR